VGSILALFQIKKSYSKGKNCTKRIIKDGDLFILQKAKQESTNVLAW